jgi:acyl-CoA reductase-like NAD-dependent aldehyde dehydrogenase
VSVVVSEDPFLRERVFSAPAAGAAEVAAAVERAASAQPAWASRPVSERARSLRTFAAAVEDDAARLSELLVREVGKRRADAEAEVAWTALSARYYADHPPQEQHAGGARVVRRPIGVVAAITPWNVPLITPAWKWLPALVAGNAVLWKPSERATAIALAARDHVRAAGVPDDVFEVLPGDAATARALAADERVGALHFTGSEAAGRALAELAAPRLARVALELSGLNPAIVLADADLDLAADCIVACGTALAGQKCTATRRVLVDQAVAGALTERLAGRVAALRVGDPRDPDTDVGPLIGADARAAADAAVRRSLELGARVLARADAPAGDALFAPVLLGGLAAADPLRARELFAPVLSLDTFDPPAQAWALANAAPYGLSAAVYGRDAGLLAEAAETVRAGVLAINRRGDDVTLEAPFGGRGRSGNGQAEGGEYVYGALTDLQAVYG